MKYKGREYKIPIYSVFNRNEGRLKKEILPLLDKITKYFENKEKTRDRFIHEILRFETPDENFINKKHVNKQLIDYLVGELNKIKKEGEESEKEYKIESKISEKYIDNLLNESFKSKRGRKRHSFQPKKKEKSEE